MKWRIIKEKEGSAIGMYIRSTPDMLSKGKDVQRSYIPLIWRDMRNVADITELYDITKKFLSRNSSYQRRSNLC